VLFRSSLLFTVVAVFSVFNKMSRKISDSWWINELASSND